MLNNAIDIVACNFGEKMIKKINKEGRCNILLDSRLD